MVAVIVEAGAPEADCVSVVVVVAATAAARRSPARFTLSAANDRGSALNYYCRCYCPADPRGSRRRCECGALLLLPIQRRPSLSIAPTQQQQRRDNHNVLASSNDHRTSQANRPMRRQSALSRPHMSSIFLHPLVTVPLLPASACVCLCIPY